MRLIPADSHIRIAAGTYFTKGLQYFDKFGVLLPIGWQVKSGWTITGAGENATTIKFESWPPSPPVNAPGASAKWSVVGSHGEVSNVVIEHLTVDGNWLNLLDDGNLPLGHPNDARVALVGVGCYFKAAIAYRHLTVTGFYGDYVSGAECFALCCHSLLLPFDPDQAQPGRLAVIHRCTVHHGHGDYCVGIASFHDGPSIVHDCHLYSVRNVHSSALQVIGKDIQVTHSIIRDCFYPFYIDTGNIRNLLMEGNVFTSNGPAVIATNNSGFTGVALSIREDDHQGNFNREYMDIPIRPVGEPSPYYRVRVFFQKENSSLEPLFPTDPQGNPTGCLLKVSYTTGATKGALEGTSQEPPYNGRIYEAISAFFASPATVPQFFSYGYSAPFGSVILLPVLENTGVSFTTAGTGTHMLWEESGATLGGFSVNTTNHRLVLASGARPAAGTVVTATTDGQLPAPLRPGIRYKVIHVSLVFPAFQLAWRDNQGEWIYHSAGAPSVSDPSKVYIQSGWSWTHWRIRNNYLELALIDPATLSRFPAPPNQYMVSLGGNGWADRDYHLADNVGRFTGVYANIRTLGLAMRGIEHVTARDNAFDLAHGPHREVEIVKAENSGNTLFPIETLSRAGNQDLRGHPHPALSPDDFHRAGAGQTLASGKGAPVSGTALRFSTPTQITGSDTHFMDELRPGDMLATNSTGGIQTGIGTVAGPFYVRSVSSQTSATLTRAVASNHLGSNFAAPLKRYRGPAAYLSADGSPLFHVMNDGSVAIRGIPDNFGFGEFYVNGHATIAEPALATAGSAAAPAITFASDPDTGIFRAGAGALGLAAGGTERARVTSAPAAVQLGVNSLGLGDSIVVPDIFFRRDAAAGILALRYASVAQAFRAYETWSSSGDYARLITTTQFNEDNGNYLIRSEAAGTGSLRSLQLGSGVKPGTTNSAGVDTLLHAGQGTGSMAGGALLFQVAPTIGVGLQIAWKIDQTGHLLANDPGKMLRWGADFTFPALKSSDNAPELAVRAGDNSNGAALRHRMPMLAHTSGTRVITENDSGRCFTNAGASGPVTFQLPAVSTADGIGFQCWFIVEVGLNLGFVLSPAGGYGSPTTIRIGDMVTSPGYPFYCATAGSTVHLVCTGIHCWVASRRIGPWFWT